MKLQDSIHILKKLSQLEQQSLEQRHLNERNWVLKSCSGELYCFRQGKMVAKSSQTLLKQLSNDQEKTTTSYQCCVSVHLYLFWFFFCFLSKGWRRTEWSWICDNLWAIFYKARATGKCPDIMEVLLFYIHQKKETEELGRAGCKETQ